MAQLAGKVVSSVDGKAIMGATIYAVESRSKTVTDSKGHFRLTEINVPDSLKVSALGYQVLTIAVHFLEVIEINLIPVTQVLEEVVVNTGYQSLPKERVTGSFTHIDSKLLGRSSGSNILERLEGVTNGLFIEKRNISERDVAGATPVVRGLSTISANYSPLVIVDNFPYEGSINNLDPSTIESVTFLKDASAASIWGARAGNGVIVITSKNSENSNKGITIQSNFLLSGQPDLNYNKAFIPAYEFIEMEYELFQMGFFVANNKKAFSPIVEELWDNNSISLDALLDRYGKYDIRQDASSYLYRPRTEQQYAIELRGKEETHGYYLSSSLNKNQMQNVGDDFQRINLRSQTFFFPFSKLKADLIIDHTYTKRNFNGFTLNSMRPAGLYPYARLQDDDGNSIPIPQTYRMSYIEEAMSNGLKDWFYRPLDEIILNQDKRSANETRIGLNLSYKFGDLFTVSAQGQYYNDYARQRKINERESYSVRNLINRFTQNNGKSSVPEGAILDDNKSNKKALSARIQLNHDRLYNDLHRVGVLIGTERREIQSEGSSVGLYGYDDDLLTYVSRVDYITRFPTLPDGTAQIPVLSSKLIGLVDRYISHYGNVSYAYKDKYILTGSARIDGSNLFGVKTNRKKVPLWSTGLAWNIHEDFFANYDNLNVLKLRYSIGVGGNVDKSTTAFPVGRFGTDDLTSLRNITLRSPGNPQLRWEKVRTQNIGVDFSFAKGLVSGSAEYYSKKGTDLIGDMPLDPTTGYFRGTTGHSYKVNYADVKTNGFDLNIEIRKKVGQVYWNASLLYNHVKDIITKYDYADAGVTSMYSTYLNAIPQKNRAVYGLYSNQWYGLHAETGDPLVLNNGELNFNYTDFIRNLTIEDLIYHGSQFPIHTGGWRNSFSFKQLVMSFNITWKAGYYFRRSSILYNNLFNNWEMHEDFLNRWREPGDERYTAVPSMPKGLVSNRDVVYQRSSALVEKGDHVRLQDIRLEYKANVLFGREKNTTLTFYLYMNNLGILWRANRHNIDPDRPYTNVLEPTYTNLGFRMNF